MNNIKKQKKPEIKNNVMDKVKNIISMQNSNTDPNGSYTGVPESPYEMPIQDADDL